MPRSNGAIWLNCCHPFGHRRDGVAAERLQADCTGSSMETLQLPSVKLSG